ncbi:hypothetical protein BVRB_2g047700 [Beta vulgaris subsp. vulgaris]|nr:hypothetical protein BVRB_2g047700 [Beta vulgaris subsp. vulgaris]
MLTCSLYLSSLIIPTTKGGAAAAVVAPASSVVVSDFLSSILLLIIAAPLLFSLSSASVSLLSASRWYSGATIAVVRWCWFFLSPGVILLELFPPSVVLLAELCSCVLLLVNLKIKYNN